MDIKDLLSPKLILGCELIAKIKLICLTAATKSDESDNIDVLKWSQIVTKLPHKLQINGNLIT